MNIEDLTKQQQADILAFERIMARFEKQMFDEGGRTYADMIGEQALALEHAADRADALNDRNQELAEEHKALLDALAAMVECHCFTTVVGRYDSARSADEAAMDLLVKAGRMERASGGYRFCEKATDA